MFGKTRRSRLIRELLWDGKLLKSRQSVRGFPQSFRLPLKTLTRSCKPDFCFGGGSLSGRTMNCGVRARSWVRSNPGTKRKFESAFALARTTWRQSDSMIKGLARSLSWNISVETYVGIVCSISCGSQTRGGKKPRKFSEKSKGAAGFISYKICANGSNEELDGCGDSDTD